jgi:hypothetical protein
VFCELKYDDYDDDDGDHDDGDHDDIMMNTIPLLLLFANRIRVYVIKTH